MMPNNPLEATRLRRVPQLLRRVDTGPPMSFDLFFAAHLPADLGGDFQRIRVASGGKLLAALNGGYEAWRAYCDDILRTWGSAVGWS